MTKETKAQPTDQFADICRELDAVGSVLSEVQNNQAAADAAVSGANHARNEVEARRSRIAQAQITRLARERKRSHFLRELIEDQGKTQAEAEGLASIQFGQKKNDPLPDPATEQADEYELETLRNGLKRLREIAGSERLAMMHTESMAAAVLLGGAVHV